jgi:hypothetical protein
MRFNEFKPLLEASLVTLNPSKLIKDTARFEKLISNIKTGNPLYSVDGTPVVIKKSEAARLQQMFDTGMFRGAISLMGQDKQTYPLSSFLKTKDYGGQSVPPGQEGDDAIPVAGIKPGQVFQHGEVGKDQIITPELVLELGAFPAGQLAERIVANKYLDSQGAAGLAVKEIAQQLGAGQPAIIPNLSKGEINNIQNYGFEYLGVLALIKGVADFPNADAFYDHVGANLEELVLYFPSSSSNPVADSYALVNRKTENTIFISSKGAKGGAPSSISALKIPDNMRKMIGKDPALTFVAELQSHAKPAWQQPFFAANYMEENYPGSMGALSQYLPFSDEFMGYLGETLKNRNAGVPTDLKQIPKEHRAIFKLVADNVKSKHPLFYNLRYYVKDRIHEAVRKGVIPNFSKRMIELLGQNFVLLKTEQAGKPGVGEFITHVRWPSKVGGTVTFEHKDPAPKWDSAMTWKLS